MKTRIAPKYLWFALLAPALSGFDFWTKSAVAGALPNGARSKWAWGPLSLQHAENPGGAFSMALPMPVLIAAGFVGLTLLAWTLWKLPSDARATSVALAMLTSGALGNQIDRIDGGTVTDFIRVSAEKTSAAPWLVEHFGTSTWPIFNVADMALVGGVLFFLIVAGRD